MHVTENNINDICIIIRNNIIRVHYKTESPVTWQPSGGSPTQIRVDTSRVGLPSTWCTPLIPVYGDPGCLHTGSACSDP